jgi:hypothetical protein
MPVFISHRTADDLLARKVRDRLSAVHGITCYLDDLDVEAGLASQTNRLTALIVNRLAACTNLLAILTPHTKGSWWVPFEIGVARQAPRMISSFTSLEQVDLPAFVTEWPVLRGDHSIDLFAALYKKQAQVVKSAFIENRVAPGEGMASIEAFHRQLKIDLRQ